MGSLHAVKSLPSRIVTAVSCVALAAAAAGCGEKGEPATTGAQVTTTGATTTSTTTTKPQTNTTNAPQIVTLFLSSPDAQRVCDDLLTPAFWRGMQRSQQRGELRDFYPYPAHRRLRRDGDADADRAEPAVQAPSPNAREDPEELRQSE